jgi:DNA-binding transcriptional ArsR family regulator
MNELDEVFAVVADYFGILSEPSRLKILHAICQEEKSVSEVVELVGLSQTNVSRHLHQLHKARVVGRRKEGTTVLYTVSDPMLLDLCRMVCNRIAAGIEEKQPLKAGLMNLMSNAAKRAEGGMAS